MPKRIQRERTKGWRIPAGTVCIDRSTKWGNPYYIKKITDRSGTRFYVFDKDDLVLADFDTKTQAAEYAVELFETSVKQRCDLRFVNEIKRELKGKDIACWCAEDAPCHGDILLEIANK